METGIDHCLVSDFVGGLPGAVDSSRAQMFGSGRCAAVKPASIAFSDFRCLRDVGDLATSCSNHDGKTGRAETSGVRLRTVCDSADSESDSVHVE